MHFTKEVYVLKNILLCYSRLSRQASLPSVYRKGENQNSEKTNDRKGIPVGSAPPPVNFSSFQASQTQPGKGKLNSK